MPLAKEIDTLEYYSKPNYSKMSNIILKLIHQQKQIEFDQKYPEKNRSMRNI